MKNDDNKPTFTLISLVKTKHDADELCGKLDELINAFYNIKTNIDKKMDEILSYETKENIVYLLRSKKISLRNIQSVQNFLIELKKNILALPVVTLHLAFEPKKESIDSFSTWITINLKQNVLIEYSVDQTLIAGSTIEWNGKYKDYSVKKKLEELYNKGELHL